MVEDKFCSLRNNIKNCKECKIKDRHVPPLYFECLSPQKVKVLVVTEQPRETKDSITESEIKESIQGKIQASDTITSVSEFLGDGFKSSIINSEGEYYWTHFIKCPSSNSSKKKVKDKCSKKWLWQELEIFSEVKVIVTFGSEAYKSISSRIIDNSSKSFDEYLWNEFAIIIKDEGINDLIYRVDGKEILLIAFPHPSKQNPLSAFLDKMTPLLEKVQAYLGE